MMKAQYVIAGITAITIVEVVAILQGMNGYCLALAVGAIASIATGTTIKIRARNHQDNHPRGDDSQGKK